MHCSRGAADPIAYRSSLRQRGQGGPPPQRGGAARRARRRQPHAAGGSLAGWQGSHRDVSSRFLAPACLQLPCPHRTACPLWQRSRRWWRAAADTKAPTTAGYKAATIGRTALYPV